MGSILARQAKVECPIPIDIGKKVTCNTCDTEVSTVLLKCAYCQERFSMWKGNCTCSAIPVQKLCGYCQLATDSGMLSDIRG